MPWYVFRNEGNDYSTLRTTDQLDEPYNLDDQIAEGLRARKRQWLHVLAVAICALCTVVNLAILLHQNTPQERTYDHHTMTFLRQTPHLSRDAISNLRRPSQFIGFERLNHSRFFPEKHFINQPLRLVQIDRHHQYRAVGDYDPKRHLASIGMISPEDRKFHVNTSVSTIAQFRAIDYGMDICELRLEIPHKVYGDGTNASGLVLASSPLKLHLTRRQAPKTLDPTTLSYATRPPATGPEVDTIYLEFGVNLSRNYSCSMEELLTFELACPSGDDGINCAAEWWQKKDHSIPAIRLIQHSSTH